MRHVARSHWVERNLAEAGLDYKRLNLPAVKLYDLEPEPLGDQVYVYMPRGWEAAHGKELVQEVMDRCPEVSFFVNDRTDFTRDETCMIYRHALMGLRLTAHDGFGNTPAELGCLGRRIVWNGDAPNAIPWKSIEDVIRAIHTEKKRVGQTREDVAKAMRGWLHEHEDWLEASYWGVGA